MCRPACERDAFNFYYYFFNIQNACSSILNSNRVEGKGEETTKIIAATQVLFQ